MPQIVENYDYGVTREWRYNRRLVIIQTQGSNLNEAVDVWAELVIKTLKEIPEEGAFFLIDDLSHPNTNLTPYGAKRSREVLGSAPWHREKFYVATVVSNSFVNRLAKILISPFLSFRTKAEHVMFTARIEADKWIVECMEREGLIQDEPEEA
ncbi:MAG: hypothetical protein KJ043_05410 [Anaerolineae bacterium]|nr:hypothetical protein [Anaerolineae bacterium]